VQHRAHEGKNYGCLLIPEGLPNYLTCYRTLIDEINVMFEGKDSDETFRIGQLVAHDKKYLEDNLSEWCFKVYKNLPKQI